MRNLFLIYCLVFFLGLANSSVASAAKSADVLILNSYHMGYNWSDDTIKGIRDNLSKPGEVSGLSSGKSINFYFEHLDAKRFKNLSYLDDLYKSMAKKYQNISFDIIIIVDNSALDFFLKYRPVFQPEVPVVFCGINFFTQDLIAGQSNITGVVEETGLEQTIDIALLQNKNVKKLVFITATNPTSLQELKKFERVRHLIDPEYEIEVWNDLTVTEAESKLKKLTPDSLVIYIGALIDQRGEYLLPLENTKTIAAACPVPLYTLWEFSMGLGIVGGHMLNGYDQGKKAAELAMEILLGKSASDIPVVLDTPRTYMFDYNQLKRFNIDTSNLPAKSLVINQPYSIYETYKTVIWAVMSTVSFLLIIIAFLIFNIKKRYLVESELKAANTDLDRKVKDISAAEKALGASEKKYRDLIDNNPDLTYRLNMEGRFTFVSKAVFDFLGYTVQEVMEEDILDRLYNMKEAQRAFLNVLKKTGSVTNYESRLKHKNGSVLWVSTNAYYSRDKDGNVNGLEGVARNITVSKKLEVQLQQAQKMESIGTLSGGIAHDFNNILFPIIGYSEMLLEDIPENSPFKKSIGAIYTAAVRARDLVKQILTFSRLETRILKLIKIQNTVEDALKLIRATIPTTIDIKQELQADCSPVNADSIQIHQIVMNLATNAYHAMKDTGGEIRVSLKEIELSESDIVNPDLKPGFYALLSVADGGTGMGRELTKKIFDPFFTTKEKGEGTGMGLSVVHGIVTSMNGSIQVYSEPGKGTEFKVYLPVKKKITTEDKIQVEGSIQTGTEKILLVDDEKSILEMETQMLTRLGYAVTSCSGSLEALEIFRSDPDKFDIVITDMAMPNMPGDKFSGELIQIRPNTPILLCSGFSEIMSDEDAARYGIRGFLMKPVAMSDLALKVREVIDVTYN